MEALQNFNYQNSSTMEQQKTDGHHHNQAAALFEERKRHYEAQQLNYLRYIDKHNGRTGTKVRSNSFANGHLSCGQIVSKKNQEVNVPVPDYSPKMRRNDLFETRPPLRSALRSSRY